MEEDAIYDFTSTWRQVFNYIGRLRELDSGYVIEIFRNGDWVKAAEVQVKNWSIRITMIGGGHHSCQVSRVCNRDQPDNLFELRHSSGLAEFAVAVHLADQRSPPMLHHVLKKEISIVKDAVVAGFIQLSSYYNDFPNINTAVEN